ncbi:MAG TPA: hypothetical protein VIC85_20455 [Ktedonobacterales bacterium]|jgi:hypothetical protein
MAEPHDASWSGDILGDRPHSSPLTIEEIIRVASFPIYRLIDRPPGLTLTSIGYCTADFTAEQADSAWFRQHPNRQQVVWQVVLRYDFLPPHKRHGRGIDVCTTEISKAPMRIPTVEAHSTPTKHSSNRIMKFLAWGPSHLASSSWTFRSSMAQLSPL